MIKKKSEEMKRLQIETKLQKKNDYLEIGPELFETFTSNDEYFAQMFPTFPNQQDKHLHRNAKQAYTEFKVYRSLEQLKGKDIIVMHGFKYTHYQYRMWFSDHEPSKCAKKKQQPNCKKSGVHSLEGKNDFVVIGSNYIAIIDDKTGSSIKSTEEFVKIENRMQDDKLVHVIKGIADATLNVESAHWQSKSTPMPMAFTPTPFKVFRFVVLPQDTSNSIFDQIVKKQQNVGWIFDHDLDNFQCWWNKNVIEKSESNSVVILGDFEKVKCVLWTLWATEDNTFDGSLIGFERDLITTDKLLKDSEHTFTSKTRLISPNVLRTKDLKSAEVIFHDILGIKYISEEQKQAFENQSRRLIITGCPGSGKTLILLARFIHHALSKPNESIVLFNFNQQVEYKKFFERLKVSFVQLSEVDFDTPKLWQSRVGIIQCNLPNEKTRYLIEKMAMERVIYVDDAHAFVTDWSSLKFACIAIDSEQLQLPREKTSSIYPWNYRSDLVFLAKNFRSTCNILSHLASLSYKAKKQQNFFLEPQHQPRHGHFVHGPITEIDVFHFDSLFNNAELISKKMTQCYIKKVLRLYPAAQTNFITYNPFFIASNEGSISKKLTRELNKFLETISFLSFYFCDENIYSTEFSTSIVIVAFSTMGKQLLQSVYTAISKARVFCNIMILTDEHTDHDDLTEFLDIFKETKISHAGHLQRITSPNDWLSHEYRMKQLKVR